VSTRSRRRGGHYRAGRLHPAGASTPWPQGSISPEELDRMQADPDLEVVLTDPPKEEG